MDLKPIPEFGGKYWVAQNGEVYRAEDNGERLVPVAVSGAPRRVRTYFNGQESRRAVKYILAEVWGPAAAQAYERRTECRL